MSDTFYAFVLFAIVATLTPGGATTLATASGSQFGFARSIPLMSGIALGLAALAASTAVGLATLIQTVPSVTIGMKVVGSAYLLWLAVRIGNAGTPSVGSAANTPIGFAGGLLLLLINPKGWTMAFGAAASYSALAASPLMLALIMGSTFGLASAASLSARIRSWRAGSSAE